MRGKVFIAFRLLVCLGLYPMPLHRGPLMRSSLPFGFWSVWDEVNELENILGQLRLHCLSAFGLFGTPTYVMGQSGVFAVFIAFRLLVCLGRLPPNKQPRRV